MALTILNEEGKQEPINGRIEQIIMLMLKQRLLVEWQSKVTITLHCGHKPEDVIMDVTIRD